MVKIDFSTLVIIMAIAFIIGFIVGISLSAPAYQNWIGSKRRERNLEIKRKKFQPEDDKETTKSELSGDSSTDAPPPRKKK